MRTKADPKLILILFFLMHSLLNIEAQKDSSSIRLAGWQLEVTNGIYTPPGQVGQKDLQSLVSNDPFLSKDLSKYEVSNSFAPSRGLVQGLWGGRLFFKRGQELGAPEFFIGLRYGQMVVNQTGFLKNRMDTLSTFVDPQTGINRVVLRKTSETYQFTITDHRIFMPLGFVINTDQKRYVYINFGLEVTPFLSFAHHFVSTQNIYQYEETVDAGTSTDFFSSFNAQSVQGSRKSIKGIGTGIYVGFPLSIYLQPFIKTNYRMKHVAMFLMVTPLYVSVKGPYAERQSLLRLISSVGIRFGLNK